MTTTDIQKPTRLAAIEVLPDEMQDNALVDWKTVAVLLGFSDVEYARETVTAAGLPLVHVSGRKKLPRWGALRDFIRQREQHAA
jgi:hypothetical protein